MSNALLRFVDATHVRVRGRVMSYFGGSNYLGMSSHPMVGLALARAARRGLLGTGASRATTGEHAMCRRVERRAAEFFGVEDAVLVGTGYLAPIAAAQGLAGETTVVFVDPEAHACVQDGLALIGVPVRRFRGGDVEGLRGELRRLERGARPLVATDGTFGVRGGMAPLGAYLRVLPRRGWLLVDDAHGAGSVGPGGRGAVASWGLADARIVQAVTFSKAFGVTGGAVLGSGEFTERVRTRAGAFVGSTAPLIPVMAAVAAAVGLVRRSSARVARLQANARGLAERLAGLDEVLADPRTPVVAVHPATPGRAEAVRRALVAAGIYPSWIRYLRGPAGGFYRFGVSSEHRSSEVRRLAEALRSGLGVGEVEEAGGKPHQRSTKRTSDSKREP